MFTTGRVADESHAMCTASGRHNMDSATVSAWKITWKMSVSDVGFETVVDERTSARDLGSIVKQKTGMSVSASLSVAFFALRKARTLCFFRLDSNDRSLASYGVGHETTLLVYANSKTKFLFLFPISHCYLLIVTDVSLDFL